MAKKQKTCSCCGGDAGKYEQWPNQDTGWGVCRSYGFQPVGRPAALERGSVKP